jgi:hypothetical protein
MQSLPLRPAIFAEAYIDDDISAATQKLRAQAPHGPRLTQ